MEAIIGLILVIFPGFLYRTCYAQSANLTALCEECDMTTGSGYIHHPMYCQLFLHCTFGEAGGLLATVKECPRGLLWSQKDMQCVWPSDSDCRYNPCDRPGIKVMDKRVCNGFFSCPEGTKIKYYCCESNERFDEQGQSCVDDIGCNDPCKPGSWKDDFAGPPECDKSVHPSDKRRYIWRVNERQIIMLCAAGTVYSNAACGCQEGEKTDPDNSGICKEYLYLPLDTDKEDVMGISATGGNNEWIQQGVPGAIGSGALLLQGKENLIVWALNNMEFGSEFVLTFRFKAFLPDDNEDDRFAIIDNSDCDKEATFGVAMLRTGKNRASLFGGFKLMSDAFVTTKIPDVSMGGWHDVVLLKDGGRAELHLDGHSYAMEGSEQDLSGNIAKVDCSMTIGQGTGLRNYQGYIDEVKFYKCVPGMFQKA